jgi:hypothetical protein
MMWNLCAFVLVIISYSDGMPKENLPLNEGKRAGRMWENGDEAKRGKKKENADWVFSYTYFPPPFPFSSLTLP